MSDTGQWLSELPPLPPLGEFGIGKLLPVVAVGDWQHHRQHAGMVNLFRLTKLAADSYGAAVNGVVRFNGEPAARLVDVFTAIPSKLETCPFATYRAWALA